MSSSRPTINNYMPTLVQDSPVVEKTKELCQAILDDPDVQVLRKQIDAFMADDQARGQYDALMVKGQMLQQKQQAGLQLKDHEIADFETSREALLGNDVARGFLDAQEDMQKMQQSVVAYVSKTFELGRVPEESDLDSGGCGSGCGCHH